MNFTICPCCGERFDGNLRSGCTFCGARAVGEPLARPEIELPTFYRALFVGALGGLLLIAFLSTTLVAVLKGNPFIFDVQAFMLGAEKAAWQLKWIAIPVSIFALWSGISLRKSIRRNPVKFNGASFAGGGLVSTILVTLMLLAFIGVTIPERLERRQLGIDAGVMANQRWPIEHGLFNYRVRNKSYPETKEALLAAVDNGQIPDPDHSIRDALSNLDQISYQPKSYQANLSVNQRRNQQGSALRKASMTSTDDASVEELAFSDYELILPGPDKILGTEDDVKIHNGVIVDSSSSLKDPVPVFSRSAKTTP
jgi:hypothetical protein